LPGGAIIRMGKFLAIDGLNIVRRVYEANPEPDLEKKADTAIHHASSSFQKLLSTHRPTHALAAFDHGGHTWRHELYPRYHAGASTPESLRAQLPVLYEMLGGIGLQVLSMPEVSAGDVIATAVLRWLKEGRAEAIVATTDTRLHELIGHGALLWDHFKSEWHDRAWVESKFGVPPLQLTELLALAGHASDGIPGVEKVGLKTAAKLLQSYHSLEGVMAGAGILKNTLGEKLRRDRDLAFLSRELATLKTDVRLGVTWKMLSFGA
jgi:DNA polymerase-1